MRANPDARILSLRARVGRAEPIKRGHRLSNRRLNPSAFLQSAPGELPPYFPEPLRAQWGKDAETVLVLPLVWVRHPASGLVHAWELSNDDAALVRAARNGDLDGLSESELVQLESLGIVTDPSRDSQAAAAFARAVDEAQDSLRRRGYAVLRGLMMPGYYKQIRSYFDRIKDRIKVGDTQVPRRNAKHNDVLCRIVHFDMNQTIGTVCEEKIKPSYCYLGIYQPGAVLTRHTDRPQCRWNVSLLLDSDPEASADDGWPIYVECPSDEIVPAVAGIGDAIIYNGTKIPHWREEMPAKFRFQSLCFFHYVSEEFAGGLY